MKLHIGCGDRYLPGYKHFDVRQFPHVDYVGKAEDLSRFDDDSVDEIYACHIIGAFQKGRDLKRFKRMVPCLKMRHPSGGGGTLRIAVPDFEQIVKEYLESKNLDMVMGLLYGGQNYDGNFHYQAYDYNRMERLLTEVGFRQVDRYDWRGFLPDGYDDFSRAYLPHMDFENGRLMSLNIIARK